MNDRPTATIADPMPFWSAPRLYVEDRDAWRAYSHDRWVYNRLDLAERLGYPCGPAGVPFPWEASWFAKPVYNIRGMSRGARKVSERGSWIVSSAVRLVPRHDDLPLAWIRTTEYPAIPSVFFEVQQSLQLNVEFIGDQVIEAHLRWGWDFAACPDAVAALPVWEGDAAATWPGLIEDHADTGGRRRVGFHYVR